MNSNEKRQVNFIAVLGLSLSIVSIPLFLLFVGQLLSLALSILGYTDSIKCNNRGRAFAVVGIIISCILLVAAPITIILVLKYGIDWEYVDVFTALRVIRLFI